MPATNELLQEGRYRISQPATGDGNVFEAYDTVRNTTVLVHEFPVKLNKVTTLSQQESMRLAFANQAKALSEIEHESLLHVQDYFSEIDRQYIVMESFEGDDLKELMDRNKRAIAVAEVLGWADQLLDALSYLHSRKPAIIHRNIQPANLRLHPSGKVKLTGVGIGSDVEPDLTSDAQGDGNLRYSPMEQIWPGLDAASQKVITNSYDDRSERILIEPLDARSDIYSLGATLYLLMTGIEPVDPLERSIDMLEGKLDPLREPTKVDSQIPAEISDVLMKALEIKRENRYDSAFIMREVLKAAVSRVEERDAEDAREQQEAAEIIRTAAQAKVEAPVEPERDLEAEKAASEARAQAEMAARQAELEAAQAAAAAEAAAAKAAAEAEQRRQDELMQKQLREAEQQRLRAEQEAAEAAQLKMLEQERAEAERVLREKEEAEKTAHVPEDNLLEIPVSAEVVAYRDNAEVDETELAAVLEELEKVERESLAAKDSVAVEASPETDDVLDDEPILLREDPVDMTPADATVADTYSSDEKELFAETEQPRRSLPIPAIAGAIGLVVVIGVGGWFAMSGSSEPPKPAPVVEVAQPQPQPDANLSNDVITSTQSQTDANTAATVEPTGDQEAVASKAAATPKPKKAEPAKNDAKAKKAVTVDDLINDN
jgi:hypothetical protein